MMFKIAPYNTASTQLTMNEKVGQLFMPAAFINDTEEEIQQLEKLISEHHVSFTVGQVPQPILKEKRKLFTMNKA